MIHHGTKYISFGYGDLCVGSTWCGLTFQNIRPPQECGSVVFKDQENLEFVGDCIEIPFLCIQDLGVFDHKLRRTEHGELNCFEFKDWKLYFIPGSEASKAVVRKHFDALMNRLLPCLAC